MRRMLGLVLTLVCSVAAASSLGPQGAQRLLTRAGFAPSPIEVERFAPMTQAQAVDQLLAGARTRAETPAPIWVDDTPIGPRKLRALSDDERKVERQKSIRQSIQLRGWWLTEMATTSSPLTERMTLFWHNHFVSAQPKVRWPQLMYQQNVLFRQHALGNYRTLLHAVARDPAMLVYLDGATNRRGNPNENFAREVMELFVLGKGQYSESDIKEAARALTGLSLDPETLVYVWRPALHDRGDKTVLGTTRPFDPDALLDLLLAQPTAAEFVVRKLWLEFVSPMPDATRVARIAAQFRASGWRIDVAVRSILLQPELVTGDEGDALVKSPAELMIGLLRQNSGSIDAPVGAAVAVAAMGQNLFAAPNVRGWPGGEAWINTQTLLARKQTIENALRRPEPGAMAALAAPVDLDSTPGGVRRRIEAAQRVAAHVDAAAALKSAGLGVERPLSAEDIERLSDRLLAATPVALPAAGTLGRDALQSLLLDPAYQLK